jgi:ribosomal subunit interface protein
VEIIVRSQHGHVPQPLANLASAKVEGLGRFLSTIQTIAVEVDRDGNPSRGGGYLIRVAVATAGPVFRSRVSCDDPMTGVDLAVDRLSRRLKEFKRRRSGRPLHSRPKTGPPTVSENIAGVVDTAQDAE